MRGFEELDVPVSAGHFLPEEAPGEITERLEAPSSGSSYLFGSRTAPVSAEVAIRA
ncbi:hypothetical protein GCM10009754_17610 [Amycolatopsis minnesotensis]|uniref:Uncharacterized protein n=1 Tax=Amycolatopsis minnesotensis TaxID=337894 RepID=A0ABN2QDF5_9PSEU